MAFKFILFAAVVAVARAGVIAAPAHGATSYSSVSQHNAVSHGYAAPALAYAATALKIAAPSHGATSYSSVQQHNAVSHGYAAPALKVAAPVLSYSHAAPAHGATSYSSVSQHNAVSHGYAAPALKVAAPVLSYSHAAPALSYAAPVAKAVVVEPSAPAHYDFEYSVHDPHTGDVKSQKESREGDVVHGSYSLIEADGSKRIVEYTADHHNGFNAVVHREPAQHPVAVKAVAPVALKAIHTAPAYNYAAPLYHH